MVILHQTLTTQNSYTMVKFKTMKNSLYVLLLLGLPFFSTAQQPVAKERVSFNNQFNIGIEVLTTNFSYTRRVSNNIRIGAGLGFGYSIGFGEKKNEFEFKDGVIEVFNIGAVFEYRVCNYLYYESKPQLTVLAGGGEISDLGGGDTFLGLKNGFYLKLEKLSLGINIFVGTSNDNELIWYFTPIQLKIPIQW